MREGVEKKLEPVLPATAGGGGGEGGVRVSHVGNKDGSARCSRVHPGTLNWDHQGQGGQSESVIVNQGQGGHSTSVLCIFGVNTVQKVWPLDFGRSAVQKMLLWVITLVL